MLSSTLLPAALAISVGATATSAYAQANLPVWNSLGFNVGTLDPVNNALIRQYPIDGIYRYVGISHESIIEDATFFYTKPNCQGQRYADATFYYANEPANERLTPLVGFAQFEDEASSGTPASPGQSIWGYNTATTPVQSITYTSYWRDATGDENAGQKCTNLPRPNTAYLIAVTRLSGNLSPPFCASPTRVLCKP